LFTRFRRGDSGAGGTGLGLAFVREVAKQHGGRAGWRPWAQGNGFFVELPAG
jgi:signal transduction histidine kinase